MNHSPVELSQIAASILRVSSNGFALLGQPCTEMEKLGSRWVFLSDFKKKWMLH